MIIMIHSGGFDLRKEKEIDKVRKLLNNVTSTGATDIELASALNNLHNTITSEITTKLNNLQSNINSDTATKISTGLVTLHTSVTNDIATAKSEAINSSNTHSDEKAEEILNAVVNILALG